MYVLLGKVRNVFAGGDPSKNLVPDEALPAFMAHCDGRIGETYFRTPRNTIRAFVQSSMFGIALGAAGIECSVHDIGVSAADAAPDRVEAVVRKIAEGSAITADALAASVRNLREAKYDEHIPDDVLRALWAERHRPFESALRDVARAVVDLA